MGGNEKPRPRVPNRNDKLSPNPWQLRETSPGPMGSTGGSLPQHHSSALWGNAGAPPWGHTVGSPPWDGDTGLSPPMEEGGSTTPKSHRSAVTSHQCSSRNGISTFQFVFSFFFPSSKKTKDLGGKKTPFQVLDVLGKKKKKKKQQTDSALKVIKMERNQVSVIITSGSGYFSYSC